MNRFPVSSLRSTALAVVLVAGVAGPAAAEDCFVRVKIGETTRTPPVHHAPVHHAAAPAHVHPVHRVHHVVHHPHKKRPQVAAASKPRPHYVESSLAQRSLPIYEMRPISCDTHPALQTKAPAAAVPPAQRLLDQLVTPASPAAPVETASAPVAPVAAPDTFVPGAPFTPPVGGVPVGAVGGPPPIGAPPVTPPVGPPVVTPVVTPPVVTPPVVGPPVVTPPIVTPPVVTPPGVTPPVIVPLTPPESPPGSPGIPPIVPPVTPPGPPTAPVPEPSAWALLLVGFFGLGAALRRRRAKQALQ
jgi:hypothetical protein